MITKSIILTIAGFALLGLGLIGVAVPVMPTTPFVLCAAVCLSGNEKVRPWLMKNRYFGSYIENYKHKRGVPKDIKVKSLLFLWGGLTVSFVLVPVVVVRIILVIVGVCVTAHILLLKTRAQGAPAEADGGGVLGSEREEA